LAAASFCEVLPVRNRFQKSDRPVEIEIGIGAGFPAGKHLDAFGEKIGFRNLPVL